MDAARVVGGGCLCGAVRYEITAPPKRMLCCHCRNCQRASGGPMMMVYLVGLRAFRLVNGSPPAFPSSETGRRHFCAGCGSPLWFQRSGSPVIGVFAGTLDDPSGFVPSMHIYTMDRARWLHLDAGAAAFAAAPP